MTEAYTIFSEFYDQFMDNYSYEEVDGFLQEVLKSEGVRPNRILEMACGTGSLTEYLSKIAVVDAFDQSEEMLSKAYEKLYRNKWAKIYKMNMEDFSFSHKYSLIVCLCDSMNYLSSLESIQKTFQNVYNHLEEEGIFVFDLNTELRFREQYKNHIQIEEGEEYFFTWENFYDEEKRINHYRLNFFLEEEEGLYERSTEEHKEYAYSLEEIKNLLQETGFEIVSIRDGYREEDGNENSLRWAFIVRRR